MQLVNSDKVLSAERFHALMSGFSALPDDKRLAVAVSGGPDSMALAYCLKIWCEGQNYPAPQAFIVDHALRENSGTEAAEVKNRLQSLGMNAEILVWHHEPIAARLHNEARKARYKLLLDACHRQKISVLFFAHQREDQAETILMRLAKGSGIDGLAGIPAESRKEGVRIVRPFLNVAKETLIATCEAMNITYVTDPSNDQTKFARGRLRRVMPLLAEEGLTIDRLIDCGERAALAKDALDFYTKEFLAKNWQLDEWGMGSINKAELKSIPRAIALRVLSHALQSIHTESYPPQHESLSQLMNAILQNEVLSPRTLNGCRISENKQSILVMREYAMVNEIVNISAGQSVVWDGRWHVSLAVDAGQDYTVKALGNPSRDSIDKLAPKLRHKVPQGLVRAAMPALWKGEEIALIPFFDPARRAVAKLISPMSENSLN